MSLLRLSAKSREAFHDHLFYGAVTLALLVVGSVMSLAVGVLIRAGAL